MGDEKKPLYLVDFKFHNILITDYKKSGMKKWQYCKMLGISEGVFLRITNGKMIKELTYMRLKRRFKDLDDYVFLTYANSKESFCMNLIDGKLVSNGNEEKYENYLRSRILAGQKKPLKKANEDEEELEPREKNDRMIERVIRAHPNMDVSRIAQKIFNNKHIREQTTFTSIKKATEYVECYFKERGLVR